MRRISNYLAAAVIIGILGAPQAANAAAFLWIAGANFSYSAATCATPGAAFYAWFLAAGAGATTTAFTACAGPLGGSASFAIAQAGTGGAGAAFAAGIADPYAGIEVGTTLSDFSNSGNYSSDASNDGSEFGTGYTLTPTGITFNSTATDSELNGLDEIAAYRYTGSEDQATLCAALGGSNCGVSDSTSAGDVTDLSTLQTDLGLTMLGSVEVDPAGLGGSTLNFNTTVSNTAQVILVGQGDAVSTTPEPASIALLGVGCVLIGWRLRRKSPNRLFRR